MGTWDELDTEVNVNLDTVELDELIDFFANEPIFEPAFEIAQRYKNGIIEGSKTGAKAIAEVDKSLQELAIATNATMFSNNLLNSIEITIQYYSISC